MRLELTRRADYAVRAMISLARNGGLHSGSRIAAEMDIPPRFVAQVMGDLVQAGLVRARTGRSGGYRLAHAPSAISILAIVEAVEGDARRRTCVLRSAPCQRDGVCDVHAIFSAAQDALLNQLAGASLAGALDPGGASDTADTAGHRPD
jgi:Rrf2 family protein